MYRNRPKFLVPYKKNPYSEEMKAAAMRVLDRGSASWGDSGRGEEITFFEQEFANYISRKHAVLLDSTIHSLYLVLQLQGISEGDEVIIPPHIEPADATVIVQVGAKPVFVDVEMDTFNMDVSKMEEKITERTSAIFPIHAQGHPTDMDPVMELAEEHGLYVMEECTHSMGARYKGNKIPIGDLGIFGLSNKSLWLPGAPAMAVTDDPETWEKLMSLRTWDGRRAPELVKDVNGKGIIHALKSVPSDLDAAVGRVQLRHLDEYIESQRKNAGFYTKLLEDAPVVTPIEKDYAFHVFLRYVIRGEMRDQLKNHLARKGIDAHVLYPTPAHLYQYYHENFGYKEGDFPASEKCKATELALPEPTKERTAWEMEYVANSIKEFYS